MGKTVTMKKENDGYTVLIVDDHDIVCAGVKSILKSESRFAKVDQASSYDGLMKQLSLEVYDILILDLNLGDQNGMHSIRQLSNDFPSMKILVLSMYPEDPYAIQSIHEGARGYVNKTKVLTELIPALEKISQNEIYLSSKYKDILLYGTELAKKEKRSLSELTQREFEVYNLIVSGVSFKEIAQKLNISPKTVSAHHTNILHKLSLSNINQLIHFSMHHTNA